MRCTVTDKNALDRIDDRLFRRFLSEHGAQHQGEDRWFLHGTCFNLKVIMASRTRRSRALTLLADMLNLSELDILARMAGYRVFIYDVSIQLKGSALSWAQSIAFAGCLDASIVPERVYTDLVLSGVAEVVLGDDNNERLIRLTGFAINERIVPTTAKNRASIRRTTGKRTKKEKP